MTVKINSALVRALLDKKDMTIATLAQQVGVSEQSIYNLLAGGGFRPATLGKLADALDTTPSDLISSQPVIRQVSLAPNGHTEPESVAA